jgi:hypothetical protein
VSYEAITWAMGQPVDKSSAKFVLVAMADCVNADSAAPVCWPSYRHLAARTLQDVKTVEAGVKRLRESGFIVDTGERQGRTGSVVVYRLNTTRNGVALPQPEPRLPPATTTNTGVASAPAPTTASKASNPAFGATAETGSDPVIPGSTPVFPAKRPQISGEATPKTGDGISKGIRKGTSKEPGSGARAPAIPGVPDSLLNDYMEVRKAKRAGPLTATAIAGLMREAGKAGIPIEQAIRACCEFSWQGFNAGWYAERMPKGQQRLAAAPAETPYQRSERENVAAFTGGLVARKPIPHHLENNDVQQATLVPRIG